MKAYGIIIYIMEEVNFIMLVGMFMKGNFLKIWHKDLESIIMPMEANILDIGTKISSMALEKKFGMMEVHSKDFIKMLQKKDRVNITGLIETGMSENGRKICSTEEVFSCGMMEGFSLVIGKTI